MKEIIESKLAMVEKELTRVNKELEASREELKQAKGRCKLAKLIENKEERKIELQEAIKELDKIDSKRVELKTDYYALLAEKKTLESQL